MMNSMIVSDERAFQSWLKIQIFDLLSSNVIYGLNMYFNMRHIS